MLYRIILSLFILLSFNACDNKTSFFNPNTSTQVILDSKIIGLHYKTVNGNNFTNTNGEFTFINDTNVSFYVGKVKIGDIDDFTSINNKLRFIQELTGNRDLRDTNTSQTLNIAVFLQSIDDDSNLTNGINITQDTNTISQNIQLQLLNDTELTSLLNTCNFVAVSKASALNHLHYTMSTNGFDFKKPSILSFDLKDSPNKDATNIIYEIIFSEDVINVSRNDFDLIFTKDINAQISQVNQISNTKYELLINNIINEGIITPIINNSNDIKDVNTNILDTNFTTISVFDNIIYPHIISITKPNNGIYINNEIINFTLNFNEIVDVTNVPYFKFTMDNIDKNLTYLSGSGSSSLIFQYTVENDLQNYTTLTISDKLYLDNSSIKDSTDNDAIITLPNITLSNVNIDSLNPSINSISSIANGTYTKDENLDFNMSISEDINISGTPRLILSIAGVNKYASYLSANSSSKNIYFRYTIENNIDDNDGISLQNTIDLNGATIKDTALNDLNTSFTSADLSLVNIDSLNPSINSISSIANGTYTKDENLDFNMSISEDINISGTPRLILSIAGVNKYASYLSANSSSKNIYFRYTIENNIDDNDGISLQNTIDLNGATIKDTALNDLNTSFTSADLSLVNIDSLNPSINSISSIANGTYTKDENLDFNMSISEDINISGTPRLILSIAGVNKYASYLSANSSSKNIYFRYTIENNIDDNDGISLQNTIDLNGATIKDTALNDLNTSFTSADLSLVNIDSLAPLMTNETSIYLCENKKEIIELNASDSHYPITYTLNNNFDSNLTEINASNYLKFKNFTNFNTPSDLNSDNIYNIKITSKDNLNNESNDSVNVTILDDTNTVNLYIKTIVYDNNLTSITNDDIVYIYFSKPIDESTLNLNNISTIFDINGIGNFTDAIATYDKNLFNSLKIYQSTTSTELIVTDTNISIKPNVLKDKCGSFPSDYNQTIISKKIHIPKTEQDLESYTNDGTRSIGNYYDDGYYDTGKTRDFTINDINKTVTDNLSNLMWQDDNNDTQTKDASSTYCDDLNLSTYTNWRLPQINELQNLLSYKRLIDKWIPSNSFKSHKDRKYWSNTDTSGLIAGGKAWYVDFDNNTGGVVNYLQTNTIMYIKCVRDIE